MTFVNPRQEFILSFEEVDTAFAELFSKVKIRGHPVRVTYYTPDVDLVNADKLPCIAFLRKKPFRDVSRWNNHPRYIDSPVYNADGKLVQVSTRKFPEPWALIYEIRLIYDNQLDGVELNNQILRLVERDDVINIKGYNYLIELEEAGMWGTSFKNFGRIEEGRRRFNERFTYRIDIWLEIDEREEVKTVQEIHVGVRPFMKKEEGRK